MAETKQEKKTFKWGDNEYLLDDLLKIHAEQENNYYNFARDRGKYDEEALKGLRQAVTNRINAVKSGQAFEGDGVLQGDQVDNTKIQTQKKGLFKKDKYVEQDNTEWAKYYLNKLVGQLKPYQKETPKSSGGWDISKHGLSAYLTGQGLNAQNIFENYDGRDANNPDAARSFTQRDDKLREHLGGYKTWLEGKGFDFTKNDNEWDDNFMTTLSDLINNQDWSDRTALSASLRKLGAGDGYTTAFTSDKWDLSKSKEQLDAEDKAVATQNLQKEQDDAWNAEIERRLGIYKGAEARSGQMQKYVGLDRDFTLTDEDLQHYMESVKIGSDANAEKAHWDKLDADYKSNPYNASVAEIILPMKAREGRLGNISKGNYSGWMYDPSTLDESRQSVLAFDPTSGKMEEIFIGNVESDWAKIKNRFMIDKGYIKESAQYKKEGGILTFQTGGEFSSYEMATKYKTSRNKERAI